MPEMEDALRSCMEQLLNAREEGEQIIVEAAREISSQQKKVRDLQHSLEVANKKAATLAAENNSLCKAIDAKDKLARELREYNAVSDEQLAGATAKLEAARKQSASLQYEAHMLQKELEVRSKEREYDLKSVDAARTQHAESLKKIALLEAECQRLRAMVRKRLPGPAALAKMRDEVEQGQPPRAGDIPWRQRSVTSPRPVTPMSPRSLTPMSPRPVTPMSPRSLTPMSPRSVTPMSPRSVTQRRSPDVPDQSHAVRLRAIEDENNALKRVLATRDTELQFARMKYADETCKLSVVQGKLMELTEERKRLSDANAKAESWASSLVSELEHFRAGKQGHGASSVVMVSDMSLLDDFAEIEKLEMASGDHQTSELNRAHSGSVVSEKNATFPDQNGSISNDHPEWVQGVWKLVTRKHEATGDSIDSILEEIRRALDGTHAKGDASVALLCDRTKVEKMVSNLAEKITALIRASVEDNAERSESVLHENPEFCARLEYLVHVCHDLLHEEANIEIFIDEVCLVLEYIVSKYFSNQVRPDTVNDNKKDDDRDESLLTVNALAEHDMQTAKSKAAVDIQTEAHKEPILSEDRLPDKIQERQIIVVLHRDDDVKSGRKSRYNELESPIGDGAEDLAQEGKQLATNSEIFAAAGKLAECQETITNLSKQLQALQSLPNSGILDYKPQSLGSILADGSTRASEGPSSPTPKPAQSKKEQDDATRRSVAQEKTPEADGEANVQPVFLQTPADDRKKKRSPSLLGRMMFKKRLGGSSS